MMSKRSVGVRSMTGRLACALAVAGGSWLPTSLVTAGEAWQALPEETVAAVRVPDLDGFLTRLRAETRLGRQILSEERFEAVFAAIQESNTEQWDEMVADLERAGFTLEELKSLSRQPFGLAMVAEPRGEQTPRLVGLGWVKLSDDQIQRILAAQERSLEDAADAGTRRIDLELAGRPVRQISAAQTGSDGAVSWDFPDDFHTWSDEQRQAFWEKKEQEREAIQQVKQDELHTLITHLPGRLIVAVGFPQSGEQVAAQRAAGVADASIDWDQATDVASVQAVLTRFLAAQQSQAAGGFTATLAGRGPAGALAAGQAEQGAALLNGFVDLSDVFSLVRDAFSGNEMAEQMAIVWEMSDLLGISGLGSFGWQAQLQDQRFNVQTGIELVGEPRGLIRGLLESPVANEPPAWVSADVAYSHLGFDLRVLYEAVREAMQKIGGEEAIAGLEMANGMVEATTQADIPTILAALGQVHRFLVLPGQEVEQTVQKYNFEKGESEEVTQKAFVQPTAIVWELADAEVWERVFNSLVMFSAMQGDQIQSVQEQNFRGLQADFFGQVLSLMIGRGHLVLGIGQEATTQVVTQLNNPATGSAAMVRSELMSEGRGLVDLKPRAISFSLQDGGQALVDFFRGFKFGFDTGLQAAIDEGFGSDVSPETRARIESLIPAESELRAAVGASVSQLEQVAGGVRFEWSTRLPAE